MAKTIDELSCGPLQPSVRTLRAAAASILNLDVTADTALPPHETAVLLAYKLLLDVGMATEDVVAILRFFRVKLTDPEISDPLVLSINDNRYAVLVGQRWGWNFVTGREICTPTTPAPLLQASINISMLRQLAS